MIIPIPLRICNAFLIKGDRPILIDTGRPKDGAAVEAALKTQGLALPDLSLLLHTHGHWDHCGSTSELRLRTRAPVAIHAADAAMMRAGDNGRLRATGPVGWLLKPFLDRRFPPTEPDILLDGETDLTPYGVAATVIPTPGHTAGSISVWTKERDVIVGDLLIGGFLGGKFFKGKPLLHYFADDLAAVKASIRKVLALAPRRVYTGHGGFLEPERVARWLG
jgi:glyoxylase-like metal-dependent hydrolase (beta-lactamase superfamily II)